MPDRRSPRRAARHVLTAGCLGLAVWLTGCAPMSLNGDTAQADAATPPAAVTLDAAPNATEAASAANAEAAPPQDAAAPAADVQAQPQDDTAPVAGTQQAQPQDDAAPVPDHAASDADAATEAEPEASPDADAESPSDATPDVEAAPDAEPEPLPDAEVAPETGTEPESPPPEADAAPAPNADAASPPDTDIAPDDDHASDPAPAASDAPAASAVAPVFVPDAAPTPQAAPSAPQAAAARPVAPADAGQLTALVVRAMPMGLVFQNFLDHDPKWPLEDKASRASAAQLQCLRQRLSPDGFQEDRREAVNDFITRYPDQAQGAIDVLSQGAADVMASAMQAGIQRERTGQGAQFEDATRNFTPEQMSRFGDLNQNDRYKPLRQSLLVDINDKNSATTFITNLFLKAMDRCHVPMSVIQ